MSVIIDALLTGRGLVWFLAKPYLVSSIRRNNMSNPDELLIYARKKFFGVIRPMQERDEIVPLMERVGKQKPKVFVEIGTANGGTLFLLSKMLPQDAFIVSLDLPQGEFGGGYPSWRREVYEAFAKDTQAISLIRADSHQVTSLEQLRSALDGRQIDFLFIDGDHTYEGVKKDYEMYAPLVAKGGMVAMHDISENVIDTRCQVHRFWAEIKKKEKKTEQFIAKDSPKGIGIIYK